MKLPFKKKKQVIFEKVKPQQGFTLENQERKLTEFEEIDIVDYLEDMFVSSYDFVSLTAPKSQYKVRYVQACTHDGEVEVEIGVEENNGTRLYYKMCSEEECSRIFLDFYDNVYIPKMEEYKPVEF